MFIKPSTVLALFCIIFSLVGIIGLVFSNEFEIGSFTVKTINIADLWKEEKPQYAKINKIEEKFTKVVDDAFLDSLSKLEDSLDEDEPIDEEVDSLGLFYPENNDTALASFYKEAFSIESKDKGQLHIVHYGDSQIEGDRISYVLRNNLQKHFGGYGQGLILPVDNLGAQQTIKVSHTGSWTKYPSFGPSARNRSPNFGIFASYFENPPKNPETTFKIKYLYNNHLPNGGTFKVLYNPDDSINFVVLSHKDTLENLYQTKGYASFRLPNANTKELKIKVNGNTIIQAFSADSKNGIHVDNISMRGSSGTEFTKLNSKLLAKQCKILNTKLLILQYGVNVVPYVIKDYTYYQELFTKQLMYLKKTLPNVSVLVVGVSDMSRKRNGEFETYPNVKLIRDAQRNAALASGCVFWDLFENMGGYNSMPSWVNSKPALANRDYTHFTNEGAVLVGNMLYEVLMKDYLKKSTKLRKRQALEDFKKTKQVPN